MTSENLWHLWRLATRFAKKEVRLRVSLYVSQRRHFVGPNQQQLTVSHTLDANKDFHMTYCSSFPRLNLTEFLFRCWKINKEAPLLGFWSEKNEQISLAKLLLGGLAGISSSSCNLLLLRPRFFFDLLLPARAIYHFRFWSFLTSRSNKWLMAGSAKSLRPTNEFDTIQNYY